MSVVGASEVENKEREEVCAIAARLLNVAIVSASRLGGSGNNRVYFLQGDHSQQYVAKFYFRHSADKRDRLEIEYSSLSFLSSQGMTNIPRPLAVSREQSCAIYEFIDGRKITPENTINQDIRNAINFVANLKGLNTIALSHDIPTASDAHFSIQAIITSLQERLKRFVNLENDEKEYQELKVFLESDFKPFFSVLLKWAQEQCALKGISFDGEIPWEQRTLSPSDFGFHNALRTRSGRVVFLDFEYFGWDDPAKLIVDFLLHPAMTLSDSMKKSFVQGILDIFKENKGLIDRVRAVYPLQGLKWCTIFLNEFVPNEFSRRSFAATNPLDASQLRRQQLLKAQNLYNKIQEAYEDFPYVNG